MLHSLAINSIYTKFNYEQTCEIQQKEFITKVNLLSALLELVLENPDLIGKSDAVEKQRKNILNKIYDITSLLYEEIFKQNQTYSVENLRYLLMYCMLSYLADKQTTSSLVIEEFNQGLRCHAKEIERLDSLHRLEFETYYAMILILSNIKNYDGLLQLNRNLKTANEYLERAQHTELEKEQIDIKNGLKITAFGNIIYLTNLLKEYLFSGTIKDEENQDINALIDMYSYNTFHLLEGEDIELKLIGHLLKYAYEKVVDNSIWMIAEKSPKIKAFIQHNLASQNHYIYSLLPSQRDVVSDVLTPKKSIIVSMPTSSGKSLLAQMQILFTLHNFQTEDFKPTVCYVVPTNALIGQVKHDLEESFAGFDLNVETALPYYEIDEIEDEVLTDKHIDILISTPEKLESLIRQEHASILNTRLVIVDEAHNLSDPSRGSKFELLLAMIKAKLKETNFMLLSPFIANAEEIGEWLADAKRNSAVVSVEWIPTQQYIGCNLLNSKKTSSRLKFYKSARSPFGIEDVEIELRKSPLCMRDSLQADSVNDAVRLGVLLNDFIEQKGNILILCSGPATSRKLAKSMMQYFYTAGKLVDMEDDPDIRIAREIIRLECGEHDDLYLCVRYGICYHNAGLSMLVKEELENLIRKNKIKMIFATTTLAQGMNFPIRTVIFNTLKFRGKHPRYLKNSEFWNIAGRAGRAFKDKEGYIILPYDGTQKQTKMNIENYIKNDLENIISSLNAFFSSDIDISFDYDTLRDSDNLPLLNLLQYINHILNVSYDYNINSNDVAKIRTILNDSFLYHSLSKEKGYIDAQMRLNTFVTKYIQHIKENKKEDLSKADELGISDISFAKVKSMIQAYILNLKEQGDHEYKVSDIIMNSKDVKKLADIINIIAKIPEINITMLNQGIFDAYSVAQILVKWIDGESILNIAGAIKKDGQSISEALSICNRYLNSQMKSYMPWGMNVYQAISYDMESDNAKLLPSYIYYGVSNRKSVILSKMGVPRFAVGSVLSTLENKYPNIDISIANMPEIKKLIKKITPMEYQSIQADNDIIKTLVDERIDV